MKLPVIKYKPSSQSRILPIVRMFKDGRTLDADLVIIVTGFNTNIREKTEKLVDHEFGELLEDS
jgi:hypothetical protein